MSNIKIIPSKSYCLKCQPSHPLNPGQWGGGVVAQGRETSETRALQCCPLTSSTSLNLWQVLIFISELENLLFIYLIYYSYYYYYYYKQYLLQHLLLKSLKGPHLESLIMLLTFNILKIQMHVQDQTRTLIKKQKNKNKKQNKK